MEKTARDLFVDWFSGESQEEPGEDRDDLTGIPDAGEVLDIPDPRTASEQFVEWWGMG